jgi:SAM-dependent methyltransferase
MIYPPAFTRFYDLIYHQIRDEVDTNFFLNEISKTHGKILETGVGTGRLYTQALERGADVYGLDCSPSMVDVLQCKLSPEQRNRVSLQDIRDFRYDIGFDLIIAPFRVFMHLTHKEDQFNALHNIYRHLNPGGRFIFDVFVPDPAYLKKGMENVTDFDGEYMPGKRVRRIVNSKPDLINQLIHASFRLEWEEEEGWHTEDWTLPLRFFFRYELEHMIERSDFESYTIIGDYQGNELTPDSKDFIVICSKEG